MSLFLFVLHNVIFLSSEQSTARRSTFFLYTVSFPFFSFYLCDCACSSLSGHVSFSVCPSAMLLFFFQVNNIFIHCLFPFFLSIRLYKSLYILHNKISNHIANIRQNRSCFQNICSYFWSILNHGKFKEISTLCQRILK